MHQSLTQVSGLADQELLVGLQKLSASLRACECRLLVYLAEVEERRLYARQGFPSLFAFAVEVLGFAEGAACRRIAAARIARRFPVVHDYLADGRLHVTAVSMLAPHLTTENHTSVLARACGRKKREIEALIAELAPKPDAPDLVRRLTQGRPLSATAQTPAPTPAPATAQGTAASAVKAAEIVPAAELKLGAHTEAARSGGDRCDGRGTAQALSPGRTLIRFTAGDDMVAKLERAKELLSHKYPDGKLEDILGEALELLIDRRDPERKIARKKVRAAKRAEPATSRRKRAPKETGTNVHAVTPVQREEASDRGGSAVRSPSRYVPAASRDAAWEESRGCCTYVSPEGRRCTARRLLQVDHVKPFALGGRGEPENVRLYCAAHNALAALDTFGRAAVQRHTTASGGGAGAQRHTTASGGGAAAQPHTTASGGSLGA